MKGSTRTKPYIYTLFNLKGFAVLADYGSDGSHDLRNYEADNGTLQDAFDYFAPYLLDKTDWPYPPDVMYYDEVPIQSPGLLLAAWEELSPERNFPIRRPSLWE